MYTRADVSAQGESGQIDGECQAHGTAHPFNGDRCYAPPMLTNREPVETPHGRGHVHHVNKVAHPQVATVRLDSGALVDVEETECVRLDPPAWSRETYAVGDQVEMPLSRLRGVVVGLSAEHPDLVQVRTRAGTTWYCVSGVRRRVG